MQSEEKAMAEHSDWRDDRRAADCTALNMFRNFVPALCISPLQVCAWSMPGLCLMLRNSLPVLYLGVAFESFMNNILVI